MSAVTLYAQGPQSWQTKGVEEGEHCSHEHQSFNDEYYVHVIWSELFIHVISAGYDQVHF